MAEQRHMAGPHRAAGHPGSAPAFCDPSSALDDPAPRGLSSWHDGLSQVVEAEIIPRLMLAFKAPAVHPPADDTISVETIATFAELILRDDLSQAQQWIDALTRQGVGRDAILLGLLSPAARLYGEMWEADRCDFIDVTLALTRLQILVHRLSGSREPMRFNSDERKVLLLPCPNEHHTFGLSIVEEFFRAAQWQICSARNMNYEEILRREWVAVVGFSIGSSVNVEPLVAAIRTVRRISRNPAVAVLVGGALINAEPDLVVTLGADAAAPDAPGAVILAQSLLDLRLRAC